MAMTPEEMSPARITLKSKQIFLQQKREVFKAIFSLLDSDYDNLITADAISITELPLETVKILHPIFDELEQIEEGIDQSEFMEAINRLYEVSLLRLSSFQILDQNSRSKLMRTFKYRPRPVSVYELYSFHPRLNNSPLQFAASRRSVDFHTLGLQRNEHR